MCGRYDLSENPAAIKAKFSVPAVPDFTLNNPADVRPTEQAPIVRLARDGGRKCSIARWGLVPSWAKELLSGNRFINARAETIETAPAFRAAFKARRCLVPVNAFYEWSGPKGQRVKWRIVLKDEPLFALAGLWEWWRHPAGGDGVETFTIVTTDANEALARIHDRMPVVVAPEEYAAWLDPSTPMPAPDAAARLRIEPSP